MAKISTSPKDSHKHLNKIICNGFDCFNYADKKYDIDAGKYGNITIELCSFCIKRFQQMVEVGNGTRVFH